MPVPVPPTRRRAPRLPVCLALLATASLYAGSARPAAAADDPPPGPAAAAGPGWSAEPAAARPGARPYFYLQGAPGSVLEDRLALVNTTDRERTLTLRGAEAGEGAEGTGERADAGAGAGAGSWISFGAGATVRVPPRTRAVVPFTVTVPPASPPGEHPAAVIAAEPGYEAAVRVHLRVSGPTLAALTVEDVAVRGEGAAAVVAYTLVNRGNTAVAPEVSLRAEGAFGALPGRPARALPAALLPGRRAELTEPWPGAPALDRVRVTVTATAPGAAPATAAASAWCLPGRAAGGTVLGLLGLGGAAGAALALVRSRRARREPAPRETPVPAPEHELTGALR